MKITELSLRNYKGFPNDANPISFLGPNGEPNELTVIIGKNGSGKSSILQAIACLVGSAARPKFSPSDLDWPGFGYEHIESGRLGVEIKGKIQFSKEEIEATILFAEKIKDRMPTYTKPGTAKEISLVLNYYDNRVYSTNTSAFAQIKGYQYALQQPAAERTLAISKVGKIFWYTEQRTSSSILASANQEGIQPVGISDRDLRTILGKWSNYHYRIRGTAAADQSDRFAELNRLIKLIFPDKSLVGSAPKRNPAEVLEDEDFWLRDDITGAEYELSNMSAGERAIFPILLDFANWNIDNSIILIDEIELHLHPPLQQKLIAALPSLGTNNQFIITTHSPHVLSMVKPDQVIVVDNFQTHPLVGHTQGKDVNSILREVLNLTERPVKFTEKLEAYYQALSQQRPDIAEPIFSELRTLWGDYDPEIVQAGWRLQDLKEELADHETH